MLGKSQLHWGMAKEGLWGGWSVATWDAQLKKGTRWRGCGGDGAVGTDRVGVYPPR